MKNKYIIFDLHPKIRLILAALLLLVGSQNYFAQGIDSDGDGIENTIDLDNDNDGILDVAECGAPLLPITVNGLGTNSLSGTYTSGFMTTNFTLTSPSQVVISGTTQPVQLQRYTSGVTEGMLIYWNEGDVTPGNVFDLKYTLQSPVNGQLKKLRIGNNAPTSNYGAQNATKQITLTWPGGKSAVLSDPLNEIANYPDGALVTSGVVLNYSSGGSAIQNSRWYLDIDMTGATYPFVLDYHTVASTLTQFEGFAFMPIGCLDSDGDGILNNLDLDSDNDGCLDAIEGAASILPSQLVNSAGTVTVGNSTASNQNLCGGTTCVDANGVPQLANPSDYSNTTGQGIGNSQNAADNQCTDSDGDGFPDNVDLDDDNDGILDTVEGYCDISTLPLATTTGTGIYKKQLVFFDWGSTPLAKGITASKVVNGVTYTATVTDYMINGTAATAFRGFDMSTWSGAGVKELYNQASTNEGFYGIITATVSARISVTATKSGLPYNTQFDIVGFDSETTNPSQSGGPELITLSADGPIQLLENYKTGPTAVSGVGTNTVTITNSQSGTSPYGNAMYYAPGQHAMTLTARSFSDGGQGFGVAIRLLCDTDNDGIPNRLDVDSDNDGCADAVEGSENVYPIHIHSLLLPSTDPNYANRGRIKVIYDGVTANTQANIISTGANAIGVPQLVNNAGAANNYNATTNPSSLVGIADNTDGSADIGQDGGSAYNANIIGCQCYKPATAGLGLPTLHGITSLQRAANNNNDSTGWPIVRKSAYTALEAKTKGFVLNRTSDVTTIANPAEGMLVFDTAANAGQGCLKLYSNGAWKCLNTQTCPDL